MLEKVVLLVFQCHFLQLRSCQLGAAILRCSWFFYNSKNLNCIGALSFFTTRGVIFEAGNETREKIWSDFGAEQK